MPFFAVRSFVVLFSIMLTIEKSALKRDLTKTESSHSVVVMENLFGDQISSLLEALGSGGWEGRKAL